MGILNQSSKVGEILSKVDVQNEFCTMVKELNQNAGMMTDTVMDLAKFDAVAVLDENEQLEITLYIGARIEKKEVSDGE